MANRAPAYRAKPGSPLFVDPAFYNRIAKATDQRRLIETLEVPIRDARAWKVPAGHVMRLCTRQGPQVGDFNLWSLHNPRERFWASRTRQLQRAHVSVHDRLWSSLPYLRPMATITADTLENYGVDEDGGRVHDLLGTRCDPYVNHLLTGEDFDFHCHSNLTRAVAPFGLTEFDVHDVLNVFQCTGLNEQDQYFMKACPAKEGDYLELFAEIDLICALSCCPGGDLSVDLWGSNATDDDLLTTCHPIGIEIYALDDKLLKGWSPSASPNYRGNHGLHPPEENWNAKRSRCC